MNTKTDKNDWLNYFNQFTESYISHYLQGFNLLLKIEVKQVIDSISECADKIQVKIWLIYKIRSLLASIFILYLIWM